MVMLIVHRCMVHTCEQSHALLSQIIVMELIVNGDLEAYLYKMKTA